VVYNERPVQTVGRRKEAIVRVRLMPGTGKFTLNGKTLETYFPNKLHQQLIREPLVTVEKTERFDIFANLQGGGTSGLGRRAAPGHRPCPRRGRRGGPPAAQARRLPHPGRRATERKKYGLKKARKAPQYSKR
jgi:small subunit ribosomal protein S9